VRSLAGRRPSDVRSNSKSIAVAKCGHS
jgi:hypothetical protein